MYDHKIYIFGNTCRPQSGGCGIMEGTEMKKLINRFFAIVSAACVCAAVATAASADYVYSLDDTRVVDEIKADSTEINDTEITLTKDLGPSDAEDGISIRFALFNEYLEADYWNNPDVRVSVDVKLETEGADVIGYIPGFDNKWKWVNPSEFTVLPYGEWITITETGEHFYEGFKDNGPNRFCFQVRTNWGAPAAGEVTVSVKNFTISDSAGSVAVAPDESSDAAGDEISDTSSAVSDETDSESAVVSDSSSTASASMVIADAPDEQITYTPVQPDAGKESAKVIIIVVVIAAVVVAGGVIGYMIYKKRKYY